MEGGDEDAGAAYAQEDGGEDVEVDYVNFGGEGEEDAAEGDGDAADQGDEARALSVEEGADGEGGDVRRC